MTLVLRHPGSDEPFTSDVDPDLVATTQKEALKAKNPIAGIVSRLWLPGFSVPEAGRIVAFIKIGDEEHHIASLNVQRRPES